MRRKHTADVAIVGGGPIGIYTAIRLADAGISTTIIEDDSIIGEPRWCTGLVSEDIFALFDISRRSFQNRVDSARVISPLKNEMRFVNKKMKVCVINRTQFDQELYEKAQKKGVAFLLNSHCSDIEVRPTSVMLSMTTGKEQYELHAKLCVVATGVKYGLHQKLGLGLPNSLLDSVQSEFATSDVTSIEVYLGSIFAPQSFAWVVPVNAHTSRIGVSTRTNSHAYLMKLLTSPYLKGRVLSSQEPKMVRRPIPVGTIRKTFAHRLLVVGDAAGQVKPISGGGIYYGLLSANIASEVIINALKKSRFDEKFLSNYELRWKKEIGFELTIGLWLRDSFCNCTDEQIDSLVRLCNQPNILAVFEHHDYFNNHSKLFKALIKRPAFWNTIYKIYKILSGENNLVPELEAVVPS
jgi:geranylgeranyl reductase family protein